MKLYFFCLLLCFSYFSPPHAQSASDKDLYDKYWEEGAAFSDEGKWDKAALAFTKAIQYYPKLPDNYGTYVNRASAYSMLGKLDQALADYNRVIRSFPDQLAKELGEVYYNRGAAYHRNGKTKLALVDYDKCLSIDPDIKSVHNKIAWLRATSPDGSIRNGEKAIEHALAACRQAENKNHSYLDTLAAAYAESGDYDSAVKSIRLAIELTTELDDKTEYGTRLLLYENKQPYRSK